MNSLIMAVVLQIQRSVLDKRDATEAELFTKLWSLVTARVMEITAFGLRDLLAAVLTGYLRTLIGQFDYRSVNN